jgi:hypothetical protein
VANATDPIAKARGLAKEFDDYGEEAERALEGVYAANSNLDVDLRLVMWLGLDSMMRGRLRFLRVIDDRLVVRFVARIYEPGMDWLERTRGLYPEVEFLEIL